MLGVCFQHNALARIGLQAVDSVGARSVSTLATVYLPLVFLMLTVPNSFGERGLNWRALTYPIRVLGAWLLLAVGYLLMAAGILVLIVATKADWAHILLFIAVGVGLLIAGTCFWFWGGGWRALEPKVGMWRYTKDMRERDDRITRSNRRFSEFLAAFLPPWR